MPKENNIPWLNLRNRLGTVWKLIEGNVQALTIYIQTWRDRHEQRESTQNGHWEQQEVRDKSTSEYG